MTPLILGTRVVNLFLQYPLTRTLRGPRSLSGHFGTARNRTAVPRLFSPSLVTIPTEPPQLLPSIIENDGKSASSNTHTIAEYFMNVI
jgi:hypothetical protein